MTGLTKVTNDVSAVTQLVDDTGVVRAYVDGTNLVIPAGGEIVSEDYPDLNIALDLDEAKQHIEHIGAHGIIAETVSDIQNVITAGTGGIGVATTITIEPFEYWYKGEHKVFAGITDFTFPQDVDESFTLVYLDETGSLETLKNDVGIATTSLDNIIIGGFTRVVGLGIISSVHTIAPFTDSNLLKTYTRFGIGTIYTKSAGVLTNSATPLKLNISGGDVFLINSTYVPVVPTPDVEFVSAYQDGSGGYIYDVAPIDTLNPNVWDDGSGVLAAVPAGRWVAHTMLRDSTKQTSEEGLVLVYSKAHYASQTIAEASIPDYGEFSDQLGSFYNAIAILIMEEGSTLVSSFVDLRPVIGSSTIYSASSNQANDIEYSNTLTGLAAVTVQDALDEIYLEKGAIDGIATLDGDGKVPLTQLPDELSSYKGQWNASTNTPALVDGTGNNGDYYRVSTAGTVGGVAGGASFAIGDIVVYNGTTLVWEKIDCSESVSSVNSQVGIVVLTASDIGSTAVGNVSATNVQAAIQELDSEKSAVGHGHAGTEITFTGAGITATNVQAAINEVYGQKGAVNGLASLDGSGKLTASQLPTSVMKYKGAWNASTNSPTLAAGAGDNGDFYRVSVAGTQNLGEGSTSFAVGDSVIYNGSIWQKIDNTETVTSVNSQTGAVNLTATNIPFSPSGNLASITTQLAIEELDSEKLGTGHASAAGAHTAANITFTANGDISATNVQAAIQEVRDDTDTKLAGKANTSHNQAASTVIVTPTGNISSTDVQAALAELDSEKSSTSHTHAASVITVTPTGNIASTNVQAALAELDSEKTAVGHTHTAANITDFNAAVSLNADVAANTAARHTHANKATLDLITSAGSGAIITTTERTNHNSMYERHGQAESEDSVSANVNLSTSDTIVTFGNSHLTSPFVTKLAGNKEFEFQRAGRYRIETIYKYTKTNAAGNASLYKGRIQLSTNGAAYADITRSEAWTTSPNNGLASSGNHAWSAYGLCTIDIATVNPTKDKIRAVAVLTENGGGTEVLIAGTQMTITYLGDR